LNTGPFYDATTPGVAGGMYLYLECSGGSLGDTAAAKMVPVDLGAGNTDLEFYYHMYGASMGNLYVQINDGSGWTTLDTLAGQQQTAGSDSFLLRVVPLTGYAGIVSIKFLGERGSNFYSDMAIDEISVVTNGNPNCPTPQLVSDSTYCTTAVMNWVSGSGSSFCEYGPAGFTPGTGTIVNNAVSPLVISGLNLNTAYDYYVYDICNGGTDTSFAALGAFTTNAGPVAAFNFGVNQGTVAFDGSISTGTNSWSWDFGDGNSGTGAMPTHTFLSNGSYNVTLVVTDSTCGITDTLVQVVNITNVATCPQPSGLFTGAVECDSAVISWTSISGASLIEYGPAGFTPGTGNQLSATSPFVLTGLNAGQSYEYWIADVCAATSDTSGFSGPIAFATPTAPVPTVNASFVLSSVTMTQATVDFDASNSLNGSSYNWDFGNATGANVPAPTATYLQNGTYFVQLTVANGCGSADTIIEVTIAGISVDEEELASSLNIFPNPTKDVVNVVIENPSTNDYSVELIDALGQLIEVQSVQDARGHTELRFDLSTRAQGVYLLRVRTGEAAITRRITRY
jgi:PKD repeat protein